MAGSCRIEVVAVHVHGEEADLDAFFDALEEAVTTVSDDAEKLWPGLKFMPPDAEENIIEWDPDGEEEYDEPSV